MVVGGLQVDCDTGPERRETRVNDSRLAGCYGLLSLGEMLTYGLTGDTDRAIRYSR